MTQHKPGTATRPRVPRHAPAPAARTERLGPGLTYRIVGFHVDGPAFSIALSVLVNAVRRDCALPS